VIGIFSQVYPEATQAPIIFRIEEVVKISMKL